MGFAITHQLIQENEQLRAHLSSLRLAVVEWTCERTPVSESECDVLIALWRIDGDRTTTCPACDGACAEPCAPLTAAQAIAALEAIKAGLPQQGAPLVYPQPALAQGRAYAQKGIQPDEPHA